MGHRCRLTMQSLPTRLRQHRPLPLLPTADAAPARSTAPRAAPADLQRLRQQPATCWEAGHQRLKGMCEGGYGARQAAEHLGQPGAVDMCGRSSSPGCTSALCWPCRAACSCVRRLSTSACNRWFSSAKAALSRSRTSIRSDCSCTCTRVALSCEHPYAQHGWAA